MLASIPKGLSALLRFGAVAALSAVCGWYQIAYHAHADSSGYSATPTVALSK
jgi:hypothetical protein